MATTYDVIAVIIDKARDHANEAREDRHPATMVLAIHELAAAVSQLAELSEKHGSRLFALEQSLEPSKYDDGERDYLESQLKDRRQLVDSYALEIESILQTVEGVGVERDPAYPPSGHVAELAKRYEELNAMLNDLLLSIDLERPLSTQLEGAYEKALRVYRKAKERSHA